MPRPAFQRKDSKFRLSRGVSRQATRRPPASRHHTTFLPARAGAAHLSLLTMLPPFPPSPPSILSKPFVFIVPEGAGRTRQ